ncbi:MAG: head decoration protein [Alphaproteobacteria bacterium]|nr:head decoration protein [Alphaproteobacteria bacterium]
MTVLTASPTLGDLLKFELNASYTRETVTLKAGTSYPLGAVLGRITASGEYRLSPVAEVVGDEGAEIALAVLLQAVDTTDGAATGLIAARGPVILADAALVFDASVDQPAERATKITQLAAMGLVARATI